MRPSLFLLLLLLLFLSLGTTSTSTVVGCGTAGVGGAAVVGCAFDGDDDPCDHIVTLQVTVVLDADSTPIQGATVFIDTGQPDAVNTRVTDSTGQVFWEDTSFLTGFSATCGGQEVGTVEPYDTDTVFSWDLHVSASGFAPASTVLTVTRESAAIDLTVRMSPL